MSDLRRVYWAPTSFFWRYFAICLAIVIAVVGVWYRTAVTARRTEILADEQRRLDLQSETLASDFSGVVTDLQVLAADTAIASMLDALAKRQPLEESRSRVEREFINFAVNKRTYDQLRLIDLEGMELVRINYTGSAATAVPLEKLRKKADRYYVADTINLNAGQLFISRFDLNVEDEKVEIPFKPTIRFGRPLYDSQGEKRAILVLNYLGQGLLTRFVRLGAQAHGAPLLLDSNGYWLWSGEPNKAWGFMFPDQTNNTFGAAYPVEWKQISTSPRAVASSTNGVFSSTMFDLVGTINQLDLQTQATTGKAPGDSARWILVSHLSSAMLQARLAPLHASARFLLLSSLLASYIVAIIAGRLQDRELSSQQQLLESEARFRQMANHISEVFWMGSANRERLIYASPAFSEVWGVKPHSGPAANSHLSATGITPTADEWRQAVLLDDRPILNALCTNEAAPFSIEYRIMRADGVVRRIRDRGNPLPRPTDGETIYVGVADDVTEYHEMTLKIMQSERLAAVGEAIAGIAHESRNALQRAQACLEMLAKRVGDRPEAMSYAHRTQEALRDLHRLYERVRAYAAPINLNKRREDLRILWRQTCQDLFELFEARRPVIHEQQGFADACYALVDALSIRQVFRNILENALSEELDAKVNRTSVEVHVAMAITTWNNQQAVEVVIGDNGPGLPIDLKERIFEPFFTTKARGTGLGMAICRRLISAHQGTIEARSSANAGLEIRILLPCEDA